MEIRRLGSRKQEEKRAKRNQIIVGIILVGVMLFSVVGYGLISSPNDGDEGLKKITYNGFDFVENNGLWYLILGNYQFVFQYNPNEVPRIEIANLSLVNGYSGKPLYIHSDNPGASAEVEINLANIVQRIQPACHKEVDDCDANLPTKTCDVNFILIQEAEEISITQEDNCVFVRGPGENLTKITDEFLFKIIGVE